jgi:NADPH-dependent 2,4-dienoyl-CoA reductase/sulfur reductase-like enzyme/peroxiredoxin family protein/rhodanese-related sulfurtransferase/TusA-related sulfurtransferase
MQSMKIIIVGGVAGGASAAARARRLDEDADIVLLERGEYISFANCGLPYHVGKVIPEREQLLVMTPEKFRARTAIDARIRQEATAIDRQGKTVSVKDLRTGEEKQESYDKLILATGSRPIQPRLPGSDDPDVLQLWTIPDMDRITAKIDAGATRALVIGGGFIGLEVAENLVERGLHVTLVEKLPQVLPSLDMEMARPLAQELCARGVTLRLGTGVQAIERGNDGLTVQLDDGGTVAVDFVVMSIGVRPNSELAGASGLTLNERGGIVVDTHLRTSDPDIYAVGDVIAVNDLAMGGQAMIPLAGPANRQGRIAAENALGGNKEYPGSLGTSVLKLFSLTAASTGATERRLKAAGLAYRKLYLHPQSHAAYYPGGATLNLKLLFAEDGRILGAQCIGTKGVEKRIDVIATAMKAGMSVRELAELELSYAPPYGSAKDPVNYAGMIATNILEGLTDYVTPDAIPDGALLLDVREPAEAEMTPMPNSTLIPLGSIRQRLHELPKDRLIVCFCKLGLRGWIAERILKENGFKAANLGGGMLTYALFHPGTQNSSASFSAPTPRATPVTTGIEEGAATIDVRGMQCPGPIVKIRQAIAGLCCGNALRIKAAPSFMADFRPWCAAAGHAIVAETVANDTLDMVLRIGGGTQAPASGGCSTTARKTDTAAIIVFSNDLDKVMAAFIIATGLATLGTSVTLFFTFWGLNVLRKEVAPSTKKDLLSRMFGWMMPRGARKLALSKMHMLGMGTAMMKHVMANKSAPNLPDLIVQARQLGVKFAVCEMAMNVMGLDRKELLDSVDEVVGVAAFAALAKDSNTTLFI